MTNYSDESEVVHNVTYHQFVLLSSELQNELKFVATMTIDDVGSITDRLIQNSLNSGKLSSNYKKRDLPNFFQSSSYGLSSIYRSYVNYYCLRLCSVLELYLKDTLKQMLKLSEKLLVKGFVKELYSDGENVPPKIKSGISEIYEPKQYMEYLNLISSYFTQGKKFKNKYIRFAKFVEIQYSSEVLEEIDNLFTFRNDIAHLNRHMNKNKIPKLNISKNFFIDRETKITEENILSVVEFLNELTSRIVCFLKEVDLRTTKRWKYTSRSAEEHYRMAVELSRY